VLKKGLLHLFSPSNIKKMGTKMVLADIAPPSRNHFSLTVTVPLPIAWTEVWTQEREKLFEMAMSIPT